MRGLKIFIVLMAFSFISITEVHGWSDWLTLKTEHFTVFYKPGHEKEAEQVLRTLEFYRPQVETLCGNEKYNFPIVIDDGGLLMAGYDDPVNSRIHLFRFQPGSWAAAENWWSLVGVHEFTHELSLSKVSGMPEVLTNIFGNNPFFMPNFIIPEWLSEGITVYSESQLTPYQGRLNDGLYDAYLGARVAENRFPSILEGTYLELDFFDEGYCYGGLFFNYLADTYGETTLTKFFNKNGSLFNILLLPKLNIDRAARKVYGKSFPELWEEWRKSEETRFQDFRIEGNQVTKADHNIDYMQVYGGKMYYQENYYVKTGAFEGFNFSNLIERDLATGKERKIITDTLFATPFKIKNGKLFYTEYIVKTGFANTSIGSNGLTARLKEVDLATSKEKTILREEIRSFTVLEDGGIIYSKDQETRFGSEIYLREPGAKDFKLLFETEYLVTELENTPRGMFAVARKDWEALGIYSVDKETGEFSKLIQTPYLEYGISFNNEKLFFSANYQKQYSVYCYDFSADQVYRLTENSYATCPSYDEGSNQLYYIGLNSNSYSVYCRNAVFKEFELPESPATLSPAMTLPDYQISRGGYWDNLKTLIPPRFWSPSIDSDAEKYGVYFEGGDAVEDFPWYSGEIGYNSDRKEYYGALNMEINYFAPFHMALSYEKDDETTAQLTMDYPMFSMIDIGVSLGRDPDYDGVETEPFIGLGEFLKVSAPRSKLKNGDQRAALYAQLKLRQYLLGSELEINAKYIDDPQNPDSVFDEIRGYDDELAAKEGSIYTIEYSRPFWKIRNGFWNPNIYFEDLIATFFYDEAIPKEGDKQSSYGLELHAETKLVYGYLPLDSGYRFVRNNEKENHHEIFIRTIND